MSPGKPPAPKAPSLLDIVGGAAAIKPLVDKIFAAIEAASPQIAVGDEEMVREAIATALGNVDLDRLTDSLNSLLAALKAGRSIQGGGADATLA